MMTAYSGSQSNMLIGTKVILMGTAKIGNIMLSGLSQMGMAAEAMASMDLLPYDQMVSMGAVGTFDGPAGVDGPPGNPGPVPGNFSTGTFVVTITNSSLVTAVGNAVWYRMNNLLKICYNLRSSMTGTVQLYMTFTANLPTGAGTINTTNRGCGYLTLYAPIGMGLASGGPGVSVSTNTSTLNCYFSCTPVSTSSNMCFMTLVHFVEVS